MSLLPFIEFCMLAIGGLAVIAGHYFLLAKAVSLGIFLVGAAILVGGLEAAYTRRLSFRFYSSASEGYLGTPALIVGLMQMLVGGLGIAAAYLHSGGMWQATLNVLAQRPWPLVAALGLLLIGSGLLLVFYPSKRGGVVWTIAVGIPKGVLGVIVLVSGVVAVVGGAWDWLDPRSFARLIRLIPEDTVLRVLVRWWRDAISLLR